MTIDDSVRSITISYLRRRRKFGEFRQKTEELGTDETVFKWPDQTVYYTIDSAMPRGGLTAVNDGLALLRSTTCLKFVQRTNQADYVFIMAGNGCYSLLGKVGGKQELSLGSGCWDTGTVYHEFMHTLGFDHEQTRPDRDSYVKVFEENMMDRGKSQYSKYPANMVNLQGIEYDYASIMHYGATDFSKNGKPTMEPISPTYPDGSRIQIGLNEVTEKDKLRINLWYGCVERSTFSTTSPAPPTTRAPMPTPCRVTVTSPDTSFLKCSEYVQRLRDPCSIARVRGNCPQQCQNETATDVMSSTQCIVTEGLRKGCCNEFVAGSCSSTCKKELI